MWIWNILKALVELIYYYEIDSTKGVAYWKDPTLISAAISLISMGIVKFFNIDIPLDLQLKIAGVITGIGALLSPYTGIVARSTNKKT